MKRSASFVLTLSILQASVAGIAGCGSEESIELTDAAAPPEPAMGSYGLVLLSHESGDEGVAVSGQFLLYAGQSRASALHALALPEQAWLVGEHPVPGECGVVDSRPAPLTDDGDGSIDLLDVGRLQVRAEGFGNSSLLLEPREFPRVLLSISGVVYDADAPEQLHFRAGAHYRVRSPGGEVGPLDGRVRAPRPIGRVQSHLNHRGLDVAWEPAGRVLIILSRDLRSGTKGVVCTSQGRGRFLVPRAELAQLGPGESQLLVARVRRVSVASPGLAETHLIFLSQNTQTVHLPEFGSEPRRSTR